MSTWILTVEQARQGRRYIILAAGKRAGRRALKRRVAIRSCAISAQSMHPGGLRLSFAPEPRMHARACAKRRPTEFRFLDLAALMPSAGKA
jgi:hypothetical protein